MVVEIRASSFPGTTCGPHRDIRVGVQVGKEVVDSVPGDSEGHTWRIEVTRTEDGDWRGKAVHGKRGERFLYLVWTGRIDGESHPVMFRRAKLQLDAVPAGSESVVGELGLTDRKGQPVCASVRPPAIRWR